MYRDAGGSSGEGSFPAQGESCVVGAYPVLPAPIARESGVIALPFALPTLPSLPSMARSGA